MNVAMIGYAAAGRSTLYRAAAGGEAKGEIAAVPVADPRFEAIVAQAKPKKATPASVVLHDNLEDIEGAGRAFSQRFLDSARKADLLLHVVRAFDSPTVPFHAAIDPIRDEGSVATELVLADLQIVENRLERLDKAATAKSPGSSEYLEKTLLHKVVEPLGEGTPLRAIELSDDEASMLRNYQFLSSKPMVVAFNVNEDQAASPPRNLLDRCESLTSAGTPSFCVCASLEEELSLLDGADQGEFLASLGLPEPASARLIRAVYQAMGLITFFTVGDNETKAWPLRLGSNALKAAATIHTDIAKGFIRAEVIHYDDYAAAGSRDAAIQAGKMSLQGKEYVVRDGDILNIRNKA